MALYCSECDRYETDDIILDVERCSFCGELLEEGDDDELFNRNEAAYERHLESLRDGGGPDDSAYRREMQEAGRGHLLR